MGGKQSKKADPALKIEQKLNEDIDNQLYKDRERESEIIKLLLLGAGESGKSTLFKQMIKLYGEGFSPNDLELNTPMVHTNCIQAIRELCIQSEVFQTPPTSDAAKAAKKFVETELKDDDRLTPQAAEHIKVLWADPGIQNAYSLRSKFQLVDSAAYFFANVDRLAQPDYLPTDEDLIRTRIRTTGIVENKFNIEKNKFLMVDVGGQRNERKKWIHCFEHVTAVIYVCAISEYDQVLFEDGKTNRMAESLKLFKETVEMKWFRETSFILFLNKQDLFATKIQKVKLTVCFPDYPDDPHDFDMAIQFITQQFEALYVEYGGLDKKLYVHVTCATDTNNVAAVFTAVKDIIIQKHLTESGLI